MTSSSSSRQLLYHHAKFRWTENLTCRFIQLRKEHGKMFTGRKYSAQAGWEYILRQMREEFPTIMADVHYRVLKKKWSNLLQQYKELKNPVHGDKNKADDISWPFYAAIDEVLGSSISQTRRRASSANNDLDDDDDDDDLNPQEFLCVSVAPDDEPDDQLELSNDYEEDKNARLPALPRLQPLRRPELDVNRIPRATRRSATTTRKRSAETGSLLSRLPSNTELTIRPIRSQGLPGLEPIGANGSEERQERPSKRLRQDEERESRLERRIVEFLEYTKKRDEENRSILLRLLEAVEDIRNAVG